MRRSQFLCLLALSLPLSTTALAAPAVEITIDGTIVAAESWWSDRVIVTDSVVRQRDGSEVVVTQIGGTVDGIGMIQIPGPPVLAVGDAVMLRAQVQPSLYTRAAEAMPLPIIEVLARTPAGAAEEGKSLPGQSSKFVRTINQGGTELYWKSGCIYIAYDPAGTTHIENEQEFAIMDAALERWRSATSSCSYIEFRRVAEAGELRLGYDGVNVVRFLEDYWGRRGEDGQADRPYSQQAAALTTLSFVNDADSDRDGEILDADIEFNGVNFAISADGGSLGVSPAQNRTCLADLGNTFTHELGHVMGLDHTSVREATMFPSQECGEVSKADPAQDDIDGICTIFPVADDPNECQPADITKETLGCGCVVAPGPSEGLRAGALWLLFAAMLAFVRRRAR